VGTQPLPGTPLFGPWQEFGVVVGELVIALGLLLLIPFRRLVERTPEETNSVPLDNQEDLV
jgi:hypothetical protein